MGKGDRKTKKGKYKIRKSVKNISKIENKAKLNDKKVSNKKIYP